MKAVITGDVVGSSRLSRPVRITLADRLQSTFEELSERYPGALPRRIDVFRGDSWQAFVDRPEKLLAIAIHAYCGLFAVHGIRTRMAMAIGTVDFLDDEDLGASDGEAFRKSGNLLGEMGERATFSLKVPSAAGPVYHVAGDQMTDLANLLGESWTKGQAMAIYMTMQYPDASQRELAARWKPAPIRQPAVSQFLAAARWDLIESMLKRYERVIPFTVRTESP